MSGDGLRDLVDSPCQLQIAEERIAQLEAENAELKEAAKAHLHAIEHGSVEDEQDTADALAALLVDALATLVEGKQDGR